MKLLLHAWNSYLSSTRCIIHQVHRASSTSDMRGVDLEVPTTCSSCVSTFTNGEHRTVSLGLCLGFSHGSRCTKLSPASTLESKPCLSS